MAYYRTCPLCSANLDPGEKCDCLSESQTDTTSHIVQDRHIKPTIRYRPRKEERKIYGQCKQLSTDAAPCG